jgi:RHS repeat-associated protein
LVRAESGAGVEEYGYAANNRRLWKKKTDGTVEVYFYLPDGRLLATYRKVVTGATYCLAWPKERVWFGGMVLAAEQVAVYTDRLGSVVSRSGITQRYYPHGEGFAGNWAEAGLAFATYERAQHAGLDQAWNRGYLATYGRFAQADPYEASGGAGEPGSWNRYGYVGGDPVNYRDLKGLARCKVIEDRDAAAGWVAVLECESGGGTVQRRQAIEMEGQRPDPREILKYAQETLGAEVDREEIETYVDPIVRLARVAFAFEDCVRLFSGTNVISPVAALRRVRYSFGQIISMVGSPRSAETKGEGLRPSWWPLGVYYNQAHIRFDIGQWLAGGTRFRLTTFIHELGHAVHYLSVGGITGGFVHDDSAIDVNRENDRLITERCVNPIASAID